MALPIGPRSPTTPVGPAHAFGGVRSATQAAHLVGVDQCRCHTVAVPALGERAGVDRPERIVERPWSAAAKTSSGSRVRRGAQRAARSCRRRRSHPAPPVRARRRGATAGSTVDVPSRRSSRGCRLRAPGALAGDLRQARGERQRRRGSSRPTASASAAAATGRSHGSGSAGQRLRTRPAQPLRQERARRAQPSWRAERGERTSVVNGAMRCASPCAPRRLLAVDQRSATNPVDDRPVAVDRRRPDDAVLDEVGGGERAEQVGSSWMTMCCQSSSRRWSITRSCHDCSSVVGTSGKTFVIGIGAEPLTPGDVDSDGEDSRGIAPPEKATPQGGVAAPGGRRARAPAVRAHRSPMAPGCRRGPSRRTRRSRAGAS